MSSSWLSYVGLGGFEFVPESPHHKLRAFGFTDIYQQKESYEKILSNCIVGNAVSSCLELATL